MTTRLVSIVSTTLIGFTCFADSIGPGSLGPNCWSNLGPRAQNFRPLPPPALPPSVKRTDFFNKPQIVVLAGQSPVRNELAAYEIMPAPSIEEISSSVRANTQPNIDVLAYSQKTLAINNVGPNLNTTMIEEADILNSVEVRVALERWMDGFSTVLILQ